ncbi:amino acid permease [Arthrobacter sp. ATA002]|nr:amino acid permease [Arthrobacter sp. ATA002]
MCPGAFGRGAGAGLRPVCGAGVRTGGSGRGGSSGHRPEPLRCTPRHLGDPFRAGLRHRGAGLFRRGCVQRSRRAAPAAGVLEDATPTAGLLQGAGFAYFAFAGYARLAAMGFRVREPDRLIPRVLPAAVLVTLGLYILVGQSLLAWFSEAGALAQSPAPLREPVAVVGLGIGTGAVAVAAAAAALSGVWVLVEGTARTAGAMAGDGDLPRLFGRTGGSRQVPWPAAAAAGAAVVVLVLTAELVTLLALACFGLLLHAAITNLCGYALDQRRWFTPRAVNLAGLAGALVTALSLPPFAILLMLIVLLSGLVVRLTVRRPKDPGAPAGLSGPGEPQ